MPEIALHTRLRAGAEAEYERLHERVPADLVPALQAAGVRNWRIWRDGQDLFHLVDVADYHAMRDALREHPANVVWQGQVGPLHEVADDYSGGDDGIRLLWSLAGQLADAVAGGADTAVGEAEVGESGAQGRP